MEDVLWIEHNSEELEKEGDNRAVNRKLPY
jgi:hypothetical protein